MPDGASCFHGNTQSQLQVVPVERLLAATHVSMETAIHSPNTFPRNPPLEATLCFHGNNHPQSQHVSVETVTRSYPVSMETTIRSHNTLP